MSPLDIFKLLEQDLGQQGRLLWSQGTESEE